MRPRLAFVPRSWLLQLFPFLRWWPRVNREALRADLSAGLTAAILVLPQGVAFATIAGMPPEYGLYAAMVPALVAALYGSSWHLMAGPTTATSIVIFSVMSPIASPGTPHYVELVLTLSLLAGIFKLAMGLARMGILVNFVSQTVIVGFTAGAGLLIVGAQLKHFFGIPMPPGISFMETLQQLIVQVDDIDWLATSVAAVTLATGVLVKRYCRRFPYMIAAMLAGGAYAYLLTLVPGLDAAHHVRTVGALPGAFPPLSAPAFSLEALRQTASAAVVVGIVGLTEAISIGRAIATRSEQRIDANQEFVGQGLANIAGAFFSAYAASGSLNRSGANYEAGAKTPLAAIFSVGFLILVLLLVAPLAAYLPVPAMAGVLLLVARGLIDVPSIRKVLKVSPAESAVLLITLLATLFVQLEFAIYAGVMLSLMLYLKRTSRPLILDVKPDGGEHSYHYSADTGLPDCPQVKMIRINGSIFFGAVDHVQRYLHDIDLANPRQKHVLIDATAINFVDVAGAEMLAQEARRRRRLGGGLYFYGVKKEVMQLLARGGYLQQIGAENVFPIKFRAISAIYPRLDPEICRVSKARIFAECHVALPNGEPRAAADREQAAAGK